MSQADAKYQGTPKGDQRCDGCVLFEPPNACKVVEGEISPSAWYQLFVKKDLDLLDGHAIVGFDAAKTLATSSGRTNLRPG